MDADIPLYELGTLSEEKQQVVSQALMKIANLQAQVDAARETMTRLVVMSKPEGGTDFDLDTMTWYGPQEPEQGEDNDETSD